MHDAALGIVLPLLVALPAILIISAIYGYVPTWLSALLIVIAHVGTSGFRKATPRPCRGSNEGNHDGEAPNLQGIQA